MTDPTDMKRRAEFWFEARPHIRNSAAELQTLERCCFAGDHTGAAAAIKRATDHLSLVIDLLERTYREETKDGNYRHRPY